MNQATRIRRTLIKGVMVGVAMFGFGFALVPIYDIICEVAGINGKTNTQAYTGSAEVIEDREVRVIFMSVNGGAMPWRFRPEVNEMIVKPGQVYDTAYFAENLTGRDLVAQAVPSVSPGYAAAHMNKIECFCFEQQPLAGGQDTRMPLQFMVDPDLPASVRAITLNYTLFDITERVMRESASTQ
ncbi:MAG: cytochrome c oxidase assembly protein [Litorivicinus sp.]